MNRTLSQVVRDALVRVQVHLSDQHVLQGWYLTTEKVSFGQVLSRSADAGRLVAGRADVDTGRLERKGSGHCMGSLASQRTRLLHVSQNLKDLKFIVP